MIERLQAADWVILGITLGMAVLGLFRGFSGTLAFLLAVSAAAFTATLGWPYSANFTQVTWMRGAGVLVTTLVAFGMVRLIVKKLVNGLLAQPSDAIFGFLVGAVFGALLLLGWSWSGIYLEHSTLATQVSHLLGNGASAIDTTALN